MKKNLTWILAAAIVVVGVGAFYGGMVYGKNQASSALQANFANRQFNGAANGNRRNGQMGGFLNGEVISKDDKSLTVKLRDGGSKIVFFSGATQILKSVKGTIDDLPVGSNVTANGQTNSDGSVTAQLIQLRQDIPGSNTNASGTPSGGLSRPNNQ